MHINRNFVHKKLAKWFCYRLYFTAIAFACLLFCITTQNATAQSTIETYMPFDPSNARSQVSFSFDSYFFTGGHRFYAIKSGYYYSLPNDRHQLGINVPVIHAIFNDDFAGHENTTGIGDLRFSYMVLPYISKANPLNKVAAYLEVTAPTGNEKFGRGVGSWVYKPGVIVTYSPDVLWYFFPEFRFEFSTENVNSRAGSDGTPDMEDPQRGEKLQALSLLLPTTFTLYEWNGWIGLSPEYSHSFTEKTYFLFLRVEVGKMLTRKTSAALQLTRFVAGQPRLATSFKARVNFFLR